MLRLLLKIRHVSMLAVVSMLVGSLVMFVLGAFHTAESIRQLLPGEHGFDPHASMVSIVESLDSFVLALIQLYFAYSVYFLFISPGSRADDAASLGMPEWLKVTGLGEMKRTLLQVIVVALSLFWLRIVLLNTSRFEWTDLVMPASIVAIAVAVRLMKLDD